MVTSASFLEDPNGLVSSGEDGFRTVSNGASEGTVMSGLGSIGPKTLLEFRLDMTETILSETFTNG